MSYPSFAGYLTLDSTIDHQLNQTSYNPFYHPAVPCQAELNYPMIQAGENWAALYPGKIFSKGSSLCPNIALTFDDVPDSLFTPILLDLLKNYQVRATFFLIGECALRNPAIIKRMVVEGHTIANHSYDHQNLTKLPPEKVKEEIIKTELAIQEITGLRTALFRPPYGALNQTSAEIILSLGYKIIFWNVDSRDWSGITGPMIASNVVPNVHNGSIILMHSICGGNNQTHMNSLQSLPYIIEILRASGYSFVSIPELLQIPAYQ